MTRLQSVILQVARGRSVDTAYDVGSVVKRLSGRRLLKPTSASRLLMVSLDGTGCLEGGLCMSEQRRKKPNKRYIPKRDVHSSSLSGKSRPPVEVIISKITIYHQVHSIAIMYMSIVGSSVP
ncbi:hypothetical protein TNCV_2148801 [Trichonephila clavipes]|nr:hypothetical protein TNCV_2148801 [Trichonephila clavipes]